jgi:hypothetical protein
MQQQQQKLSAGEAHASTPQYNEPVADLANPVSTLYSQLAGHKCESKDFASQGQMFSQ